MATDTITSLEQLRKDLRKLIQLSILKKEFNWSVWTATISNSIEKKCWEELKCDKCDCPAYEQECGRCLRV